LGISPAKWQLQIANASHFISRSSYSRLPFHYNLPMKFAVLILSTLLGTSALAQTATVPITLDHNRVIIDVYLPLPDGTSKRVRAWVDSGDPELWLSEDAAKLMGLSVSPDPQDTTGHKSGIAKPPASIRVGKLDVPLTGVKEARVLLGSESVGPGLSAEISLPSTVLRNYDVLVNYPDREFTLAAPGTLHFQGQQSKLLVNADNGLAQVPAKIEGKNYNLGLDVGSSISMLLSDVLDPLLQSHPQWARMTGATGIANMWGNEEEMKWQLARLPRVQYGPIFLTDVAVVEFSKQVSEGFEKRAGMKTAGLLGANALLPYRVGLDYKRGAAYFDIGMTFKAPDMDVIGLILRPELDGRYTIIGVADYNGKPSVEGVQSGDQLISVNGIRATGGTMGQVWSSLEGSPGQERTLTIERAGKQIEVKATVQHFLAAPDDSKKSRK
jgi:hypothetical protein